MLLDIPEVRFMPQEIVREPPLRAFGDVRPMLLRAMMSIAYSFDRSVIDSTEPLTKAP